MRRIALTVVILIAALACLVPAAFAKPSVPRAVTKPHVTRGHEHRGRLGVASTVGGVLNASAGTWTNTPTGYTYEWQDCNLNASQCTNIPGATTTTAATSNTYTIQSSDVGFYVRVGVQATNATGPSPFIFSTVTAQITSTGAPANTVAPAVSGTTQQAAALTTTTGTWTGSPTSFAYQWQRCTSTNTATCSNIAGATTSTYTLASGDVGDFMRVGVSATNSGGTTGPAFSTVTSQVSTNLPVNTLMPSLAGSAVQGDVVTLTPGTFSNETSQDGTWEDCPTATSTSCSSIVNSGNTYTLAAGDVADYVRLMEVATNANGTTTVWSNAIGPVTASSGSSGYTGTCNATISPSSTSNAVGAAESALSAGQVLCLNSGSYGTPTTTGACIASNSDTCSGVNANRYTASGTSGNPIIVTSGPGQTATIQGANSFIGSWITLENLNIDEANQISHAISSPVTAGANPVPPCNVSVTGKTEAIEFENGSNDSLLDNNIYDSLASTREINIFITANNVTIRNNNISNAGSCGQTEHLIYDDAGSGTQIDHNWFWSDQFGYAVQLYPNPGTTRVYSNVMDGTLDGFVDDSSVGGNSVTNNVVINPVAHSAIISGQNSQSFTGGAFQSCFHDQSGATDTQSNNAVFNAANGFGCTSETGITITGQLTLPSNPFVSSSTHNYTLCATGNGACTSGQITAAGELSGYNLWNGVGPPTPNPALSLTSTPLRPTASPEQTTPWWIVTGGIAALLACFGAFGVVMRRRDRSV